MENSAGPKKCIECKECSFETPRFTPEEWREIAGLINRLQITISNVTTPLPKNGEDYYAWMESDDGLAHQAYNKIVLKLREYGW